MTKPKSISEYINSAPNQAKEKLTELRALLKEIAPDAKEAIKWGSPVLEDGRILFAFTAFKDHINFMPTHASLTPFEKELKNFKTGKDTMQITYDKPLPTNLIKKIALHRVKDVKENGALWLG